MENPENYSSIMFFSSNIEGFSSSVSCCFPLKPVNDSLLSILEFSSNAKVDTLLVLFGVSSAVNPALPKGSRPVLA